MAGIISSASARRLQAIKDAEAKLKGMAIPGASVSTFTVPTFTEDEKIRLKKAQAQLKGVK